jgi:hypothetical protein
MGPMQAGCRTAAAALCALALALAFGAPIAAAQDRVLRAEIPVDLEKPPSVAAFEGVVDPAYVPRVPDGEAAKAVLAEAQWLFSGMVWGFDYVYTPSDRSRSIAELFQIRPRSPESAKGMELHAADARLVGTVLVVTVEYTPDTNERDEMASWKSGGAASQGTGSARSRREAVAEASKAALRAYLREITHNKPREIRGSFAFTVFPRLFIRQGAWVAVVRMYTRVDEILSYGAY